jgi:DNA-binding transcriptional MerR regulator
MLPESSAPGIMHIGELAEKTSLSLRTIRHYDDVGLLKPRGRTDGGFRLYSDDDVEQLLLIRRMKPLGFSIEEMGQMLALIAALRNDNDNDNDLSAVREALAAFIDQARERRLKLRDYVLRADELVDLMEAL